VEYKNRQRASLLICAVVSLTCGLATGATPESGDRASDTAELNRLATESGHAYARRDLAMLERLTAEDYVQTDVRGGVLDRVQWRGFVKNRKSEQTIDTDDVKICFYGDVAVVRGHWTYTFLKDGNKIVAYSQWTSVWSKYPHGWKRHTFQNTYINPNADHCAMEASH
jgi:ketosteroid isomerase-like protein